MPDGDIIHSKLKGLYQKPYQWLCEGKATSDECAQVVMKAFKKDLMQKGDLPVILVQKMAESLILAVRSAGENGAVDWTALSQEFDRLIQQVDGPHYLKDLALQAGKSTIHEFRYGQEINIENASEVILRHYMHKVYESEFKERIPLTSEHHAGIDQITLSERIEEIQPNINVAIDKWTRTANEHQSVAKLRLPRRILCKQIDMDEDLLAA